jgi:hypothetical protein
MKLQYPNILPDELVMWVEKIRKQSLKATLRRGITSALDGSLPELNMQTISQEDVDSLDERYFSLEEQSNELESKLYFHKARLAAAGVELQAGDVERALYEFFHAQEDQNVGNFIVQLENT